MKRLFIILLLSVCFGLDVYTLQHGAILNNADDSFRVRACYIGDDKVATFKNNGSATFTTAKLILSTVDRLTLTSVEETSQSLTYVERQSLDVTTLVEEEKIIVSYRHQSTKTQVRVGTISGTTITLGTATITTSNTSYVTRVVRLSDTKFVVFVHPAGGIKYQIGTVSGTTITLGVEQDLYVGNSSLASESRQLENNKIVIMWHESAVGYRVQVGSYSAGDALTLGTTVDPGFLGAGAILGMDVASPGRAILSQWSSAPVAYSTILYPAAISGLTVTIGNATTMAGVQSSGTLPQIVVDGGVSEFYCFYSDYSNSGYITVIFGSSTDTTITLFSGTEEVVLANNVQHKKGVALGDGYAFINWGNAPSQSGRQQIWGRASGWGNDIGGSGDMVVNADIDEVAGVAKEDIIELQGTD